MNNDQLLAVKKLFAYESKSIKFLESYYEKVLGIKNLKIELSEREATSYCDISNNRIVISAQNLKNLIFQDSRITFKMFYTILLHEIGHAIYTSSKISYSEVFNILEDNRLEFQITLWNKAVRFDVVRYALFDKEFESDFIKNPLIISSRPTSIGLALLRTIDNTPYVEYFSRTEENANRVKRILQLDMEFMMEDAKANMGRKVINKLENIVNEVTQLLVELTETQPQPPQPKQTKTQNGGEEPPNLSGGKPTNAKGGPSKNDIKKELEKALEDAKRENEKVKKDATNGIGKLVNPNPVLDDYKPLDITAFQVARTMGMRGTGTESRVSGSARQLSLRKYMRKDFDRNVKPFEKPTDVFSVNGKSSMVSFYIDISGSMSGYPILQVTRYLKTFYDTMHKNMYIRFFGFGRNTYEMTRDELELRYVEDNLEGATYLSLIEQIKQNEHVIILTDGAIHGEIPQDYRDKATFIIVGYPHEVQEQKTRLEQEQGVNANNIIGASLDNIQEGLDRATAFIKKVLQ
jgi:hypothetical protein